jgi:pilus assembly protein Flp/PilA
VKQVCQGETAGRLCIKGKENKIRRRQMKMLQRLFSLLKDDEGQGLAEYALILVLIAVVVIGALTLLGGNIESVFNRIATEIVP